MWCVYWACLPKSTTLSRLETHPVCGLVSWIVIEQSWKPTLRLAIFLTISAPVPVLGAPQLSGGATAWLQVACAVTQREELRLHLVPEGNTRPCARLEEDLRKYINCPEAPQPGNVLIGHRRHASPQHDKIKITVCLICCLSVRYFVLHLASWHVGFLWGSL